MEPAAKRQHVQEDGTPAAGWQELHDSGEAEFGAAAWRAGVEEAAAEVQAEAAAAAAAAAATPMTREQAEYAVQLAEWQRQQDEYQRGQDVRPHTPRRAA